MGIKNGEIADADEVMNAFGSLFNDIAQNIFNADYIGFDSRLSNSGTPRYKNIGYDTFTSNTATTKTNFTYDSTNDLYSADQGVASATLEVDFGEVVETITNIIPVVNMGDAKTYTNEVINNSFESVVGAEWTYNEQDTGGRFTDAGRTSVQAKIGTWSYAINVANNPTGASDFGEIQQTVDLTNATHIGCYIYHTIDSTQIDAKILIDNTEIIVRALNTGSGSWTWVTGIIPKSLRTSGKIVKLRVQKNTTAQAGSVIYFDYLDIWNETESISTITIAADGTNFESVDNKKILRPSNTGTNPKLRVVLTKPATGEINTEINFISEEAIKYNFY